jgi:putative ABC transport system permease protein
LTTAATCAKGAQRVALATEGCDVNLALKDIRHNLGRFLLTCVGLSLLLGIVLAMVGIYRGLVLESLGLLRAAQAQVWVVEGGTRGPFAEASRLPGDTREIVAAQWGVAAAGAVAYQNVEAQHRGAIKRLFVVGAEIGRLGGAPSVVDGRPILHSRYEAVADRRTGLTIGERVKLGRDTFTVVGLTDKVVASSGDPVVFITLRDAQQLQFDLTPAAARREAARLPDARGSTDTVNAVLVRLLPGVDAKHFADTIARWKHLSALTQNEQEIVLSRSVIERARAQIGLFTSLLLIVSTVIIGLIIYTMTIDKKKSIATLKLIGAPDRRIVGLIVQQSLAMGIISFVVGTALINSAHGYFPRRVVLEPTDATALFGIVLLVCLLASGLGVRTALKVDPASALAG